MLRDRINRDDFAAKAAGEGCDGGIWRWWAFRDARRGDRVARAPPGTQSDAEMGKAKFLLKTVLQRAGYQLKRRPRSSSVATSLLHLDPFYDQQFLLGKHKVRVILDVGANVGQTAAKYRAHFPQSLIISF
jgi:hypothetical protein